MLIRVAAGVALWTAAAVPVALVIGRAVGASGRTVADEAECYLRNHALVLPRRRRRRTLAGLGMLVMIGIGTPALAVVHLPGGGGVAAPRATVPDIFGRQADGPAGGVSRPATAARRPESDRHLGTSSDRRSAGPPSVASDQPEATLHPNLGDVDTEAIIRVCTILDHSFGIATAGLCGPSGAAARTFEHDARGTAAPTAPPTPHTGLVP